MIPQIKQRIEEIRRGEVPEGYKKTKVGIVPEEWENKKLGELYAERNDVNCSDEQLLSITADRGVIPRVQIQGKDNSSEDKSKYKHISKGDIGYNTMRMWQGVSALSQYDGIVSPAYTVLKPSAQVNALCFSYLFKLTNMINVFYRHSQGLVDDTRSLKYEWFKNIAVSVPSLPEQKKIADILSAQDKLIELQQKKIDELKRLKKVYLSKMFPKKGCNVPEIRFPGFTDAWEQRKVSDVAEICTGGTPSTGIEKYWYPKEIPWLSSGEVHKKYITYTDNKISVEGMNNSSARMIPENSVLIALAGQGKTRGTVAINRIPLTTNQSIASMAFFNEVVPEFVFCNLESRYEEIRRMSSGDGSRGGLNKQIIGEMEIPYTSKEEQTKIGAYFFNLDNLITLHQRKLDEEQKKKKSLMQLLLTGIVRVEVK